MVIYLVRLFFLLKTIFWQNKRNLVPAVIIVYINISGDNNEMDDRMLYVPGQFWLQRQHIMGKAIG